MAILVPDNLKSSRHIPAVARKIAAVLERLPTEAIVWYEPLFDPDGERPDFVVWLPDRGIAVLEIFDENADSILGTKRGKIVVNRNGAEVKIDNPTTRADRFLTHLRQQIEEDHILSALDIRLASAALLPFLSTRDILDKELQAVFDESFIVCRDDLEGSTSHAIMAAFRRLIGDRKFPTLSKDIENRLRAIVQPEIVIDRITGGLSAGNLFQRTSLDAEIIRVMDQEQENVAKSLGEGHRVIKGVAGSGKTLILVFRAKLLARCNPASRYLVVCYGKALAGHLKRLLADYDNIDIANIDKLARDLAKKNGSLSASRKATYDSDLIIVDALRAIEAGKGDRYHGVLVDESQDLSSDGLLLLTKLLLPESEDLLIVADAAQNIYRRKFSWKSAGIKAQGRTKLLGVNYRNTKEILGFASSFLFGSQAIHDLDSALDDEYSYIPPQSSKRSGSQPELKLVRNAYEEITETVAMVSEWTQHSPAKRIAVLYPGTDGINRGRRLHDQLKKAGLKFLSIYTDESAKFRLSSASENVVLSTVQSAKGLEFSNVIVCGTWKDGEDTEGNRKLAYVAMTRATEHLAVVSRDNRLVDALRYAMENPIHDDSWLVQSANKSIQNQSVTPLVEQSARIFEAVMNSGSKGITAKAIARNLEIDLNDVKLALIVELTNRNLVYRVGKTDMWRVHQHTYALYSQLCPKVD